MLFGQHGVQKIHQQILICFFTEELFKAKIGGRVKVNTCKFEGHNFLVKFYSQYDLLTKISFFLKLKTKKIPLSIFAFLDEIPKGNITFSKK